MSDGHRRLIVCCDGTWNGVDRKSHITNVVKMAHAITPIAADGTPQIVEYSPGVGTGNVLDRFIGGALGVGLAENVRNAYAFLVNNYMPGDEIFLFGFSRGAYTVRSVGGLLGTIGILTKPQMDIFPDIWEWYRQGVTERNSAAQQKWLRVRVGATRSAPIKFIGVWDTVGSLGIPNSRLCQKSYRFFDTDLGLHVAWARQALAIDERRPQFKPAIWKRAKGYDPKVHKQDLKQVWFAGVHSNVGGGYIEHGLSDVTFLWMASEVAPMLDLDWTYIRSVQDLSADYALGYLEKSFKGLYLTLRRLVFWNQNFRPYNRPVCVSDPASESVHDSVRIRISSPPVGRRRPRYRSGTFLDAHPVTGLVAQETDLMWKSDPNWKPARPERSPKALCDRLLKLLGGY